MKYKVGDKVRIKSIDWYNNNKDKFGNVNIGNLKPRFTPVMSQYCGQVLTVNDLSECDGEYYMLEDGDIHVWTDEMIERLVEDGTIVDYVKESNDRYRIVIDPRFDIEVDEGEYYAVRRKKEYPKTYEECCNVLSLGEDGRLYTKGYKASLIQNFQKLIICLDAYWKIAGEEMGLGKSWEPDYTDPDQDRYAIVNFMGNIEKSKWDYAYSITFVFPTEEMRDAFKENFEPDVEFCKEFL